MFVLDSWNDLLISNSCQDEQIKRHKVSSHDSFPPCRHRGHKRRRCDKRLTVK